MARNIPRIMLQNMSAEERAIEYWRKEKVKTARKLRTAERVVEAKKSRAHYGIVVAAKAVVAAWATNRLAEAVRDLDAALKSYDEVIK